MKTLATAIVAAIGLTISGVGTNEAKADSPFGIHFGGSGFHVDIGHVHHGPSYGGYYGSRHVTRYYSGYAPTHHHHYSRHYGFPPTTVHRYSHRYAVPPRGYDCYPRGYPRW